jgi:hypothetical protein
MAEMETAKVTAVDDEPPFVAAVFSVALHRPAVAIGFPQAAVDGLPAAADRAFLAVLVVHNAK